MFLKLSIFAVKCKQLLFLFGLCVFLIAISFGWRYTKECIIFSRSSLNEKEHAVSRYILRQHYDNIANVDLDLNNIQFVRVTHRLINHSQLVKNVDYKAVIAIGGGITSKHSKTSNFETTFQIFSVFLPSFCRSVKTSDQSTFVYRFYLGYDDNDKFFNNKTLSEKFMEIFNNKILELCSLNRITLRLLRCNHHGRPAWAQNDVMITAYLDGADYFYRVNDDTILLTTHWTEKFIERLHQFHPPLVGVVGPHHSGGNTAILTYDFVHRTHVEIFGFYYPRVFTDWFADRWITNVYSNSMSIGVRSDKLRTVRLKHTMKAGTRYNVHRVTGKKLLNCLHIGRHKLNTYDLLINLVLLFLVL